MNFKVSLIVSLMLHAAIIGVFYGLFYVQLPRTPKVEMLVVEFDGTVSKRQNEEAQLQKEQEKKPEAKPREQIQPAPSAPPQIQEEVMKEIEKDKKEMIESQTAINQKKPEHKEVKKAIQVPPPKPQQTAAPALTPQLDAQAMDKQSKQETIAHERVDVNEFKRYLANLKKELKSHVVYPETAKNLGIHGNPYVQFSVDLNGNVDPRSIIIKRSSGSSLLDEYAIKAVLASSPFSKPSRMITLDDVEITFTAK